MTPFLTPRFLLIAVMILSVAASEGCAATIKRPKTVELTKSIYPDFPYRIEIRDTEVILFNVHQLKAGHAEEAFVRYVYLKRRTGILQAGEFVLNFVDEPIDSEKIRGTLTLNNNTVSLAIDEVVEESPSDQTPTKYRSFQLNGRYELLDKTGEPTTPARPEPTK